jgi:hypothetical protein
MNPNTFASGSCRLLCCFDTKIQTDVKKKCNSLHHFNMEFQGGYNFLGKLHTARQHLLLLKFLMKDVSLSKDDQGRLLSMSTNSPWFEQYFTNEIDYSYSKSLSNIRQNLTTSQLFLFEICSMKNALHKDTYLPVAEELEGYRTDLIRSKSKEECKKDILDLIHYVNKKFNKPKIVLVGHIRNWIFNKQHAFIADRQAIYELLVEMDSTFDNVYYIDPAVFLTNDDLLDDWHYKPQAYSKIYKKICTFF